MVTPRYDCGICGKGDKRTVSANDGAGNWSCRGIRGATTAIANTAEDILEVTDELMRLVIRLNDLDPDDVASADLHYHA